MLYESASNEQVEGGGTSHHECEEVLYRAVCISVSTVGMSKNARVKVAVQIKPYLRWDA